MFIDLEQRDDRDEEEKKMKLIDCKCIHFFLV